MQNLFLLKAASKGIDYIIGDVLYTAEKATKVSKTVERAIQILDSVKGITPCHDRDFKWSRPLFTLDDGSILGTCTNVIGLDHVFLANSELKMIYGAFVTWKMSNALKEAIEKIRTELT
jgi:hypothetical protein